MCCMCVMFQDIAVHTRVTPQNRQIGVRKFLQSVKNSPEASAKLSMWGLELDSDTIKVGADAAPYHSDTIKVGADAAPYQHFFIHYWWLISKLFTAKKL